MMKDVSLNVFQESIFNIDTDIDKCRFSPLPSL
jgi:hypothetical protein